MYILKRTDQGGGYVSVSGSKSSYTHNLERAQIFRTKEHAEANRCPENEMVLNVNDILQPNRL